MTDRTLIRGGTVLSMDPEIGDLSTGDVLIEIPQATREDMDEAYRGAARAQVDWARKLPGERAEISQARRRARSASFRCSIGSSENSSQPSSTT